MSESLSQPEPLFAASKTPPERPSINEISEDEGHLLEALRLGAEAAFIQLIGQYHSALVRLALMYVSNHALAEEIAQETWLAVLQGIHRFEGRSSLKTWIFSILINQAKKRAQREGRQIPFSAMGQADPLASEPSVEPDRFLPADDPHWANHWAIVPDNWQDLPESRLLSQETLAYLRQAINTLPPNQREVISLRDVEGWSAPEVCQLLGISEVNQRVLLHRARAKVRQILEDYLQA